MTVRVPPNTRLDLPRPPLLRATPPPRGGLAGQAQDVRRVAARRRCHPRRGVLRGVLRDHPPVAPRATGRRPGVSPDGLQPGGAQPGRLRQESRPSHAPRRGVGAGAGVRCDLGGGGTVGTFAPDDGARQGRRLHARRPVGGGGPVWRAGARRADPGRRRGGDDDLARRGRASRHRAGAARRVAGCVSSLARPSAPLIPP